MRIRGVLWLQAVVDKLAAKHGVDPTEVEEVLEGKPHFRFMQRGDRPGEDVYLALGRSDAGRYLAAVSIHKSTGDVLILSARDMADKEKKLYGRQ